MDTMLRGNLDLASHFALTGWAQDTSCPAEPVRLILVVDGTIIVRLSADQYRQDLQEAEIGSGQHAFELIFPARLSPLERHIIEVYREEDGEHVPGSPVTLEAAQLAGDKNKRELGNSDGAPQLPRETTLAGNFDLAGHTMLAGWAQDASASERPVSLIVTVNDKLVGRVLANRYRQDLKDAGIGSGRHAFEFGLPTRLSPLERHVIEVFREIDGEHIPGSPVTLEASSALKEDVKAYLNNLFEQIKDEADVSETLGFFAPEIDRLKQRLADLQSKRHEREQRRVRRLQAGKNGQADHAALRALIIDDRSPKPDRDAGSNAILGHMQSLQRLGYDVAFVPAEQFSAEGQDADALAERGIVVYGGPLYGSVEDVMRRQRGTFDLVYLHRVSNASKYQRLARHYFPKARLIFSVADLHHMRFARQAQAEDRPELMALSKRTRLLELAATAMSDTVITHSSFEAEVLRKEVRGARVHVVPWLVSAKPTRVPFDQRRDIAFVGGFGHAPNQDAARRLIREIMPLVRQQGALIECLLVGSEMPQSLSELCGNGVIPFGHAEDLQDVFDRVRLTVAPLSYGAGIKGKVIESIAAGIPCVCTPVAAEGLDLPPAMQPVIADSAQAIAAAIVRLHEDAALNDVCRQAGLGYVSQRFTVEELDRQMRLAVG